MTDVEIANQVKAKSIIKIAKKLSIKPNELILYGNNKAKLPLKHGNKKGKLILVTAITPTSAGIGKTTVSIGLADALASLKKNVCLALREPSLGPVFGIKGGATGGGYAQIIPMEDINLHFTGDFHAITSANNLLSAMIDNHIFQGNQLKIKKVLFNRCLDMNDRALRNIETTNRKDCFVITAASEIMAILCLAKDFCDLKEKMGNILVALNESDEPVYAKDIKANEAMAILLKDAIKPNLVQTLAGTPAIVHGGPFANIAHGCNSIIATKMALSLSDYCITEAGFGADLGAEKFFDIKCRTANLKPDAVVLVATIQALKIQGGGEDIEAIKIGIKNLEKHTEIIKNVFGLHVCVTINKFDSDTEEELGFVKQYFKEKNINVIVNDVWAKGGKGALDLANEVISMCKTDNNFKYAYTLEETIENKIKSIAKSVYGAKNVIFEKDAKESIEQINKFGYQNLPVVIAKTQFSFSDNPKLLNVPTDFDITIKDLQLKAGAGFIVAIAGNMLLMPGLSKQPNAEKMTIDEKFVIKGMF